MTISNTRKLINSNRCFIVVSEHRVPSDIGVWWEDVMFLDTGEILTILESDLQKASIDMTPEEEKKWPNAIARGKVEIEKRRKS